MMRIGRVGSIAAEPSGLRALPDGTEDPRKVENLLNGRNFTRNDLHVWLAPVAHGENEDTLAAILATVSIAFKRTETLSMLRVFNMNKSRTHNQRGVRQVRVKLDGNVIFEG